jgi:YD repeat-containing protein
MENQKIVGWKFQENTGDSEIFDSSGRLTEMSDASGFKQTLSYDNAQRLTAVVDASDRAIRFEYNADDLVNSALLPDGQRIWFYYSASKDLETIKYQDGTYITYLYDEATHIEGYVPTGTYTGLIDEMQNRYSTTTYTKTLFEKDGKAVATYLGNNLDRHAADYTFSQDGSYATTANITSGLGASKRINFALVAGVVSPRLDSSVVRWLYYTEH